MKINALFTAIFMYFWVETIDRKYFFPGDAFQSADLTS